MEDFSDDQLDSRSVRFSLTEESAGYRVDASQLGKTVTVAQYLTNLSSALQITLEGLRHFGSKFPGARHEVVDLPDGSYLAWITKAKAKIPFPVHRVLRP